MNKCDELETFRYELNVRTKGRLAVVVQLTRAFASDELPINPEKYRTKLKGQVAGLGGSNLRMILEEHGIKRVLAKEAGRTSRGSMELMEAYAAFINGLHPPISFVELEDYWVQCIKEYFSSQPLRLSADPSKSIGEAVGYLLSQAEKRQRENPGTQYMGTVLQHLVAAKLNLMLDDKLEIFGASVADDQTNRSGDFVISDTVIHCTTAPANLLIEKCKENLLQGLHPVIVTIAARVTPARALLEDAGVGDRVDVWDLQQFLSINIFEHGSFRSSARMDVMGNLIDSYNGIVEMCETDPSLRIEYNR